MIPPGDSAADTTNGVCDYTREPEIGCGLPATNHLMISYPTRTLTLALCIPHLTNIEPYLTVISRHPYRPSCSRPNYWHDNILGTSWCGPAWNGP